MLQEQVPGVRNYQGCFFMMCCHRINTEQISDCRSFFYDCPMKDRIDGRLSVEQAVLGGSITGAQNQGTYQSTDERTISPMMFYECGNGRKVTSPSLYGNGIAEVGIPARQVYSPRWAHCDDEPIICVGGGLCEMAGIS